MHFSDIIPCCWDAAHVCIFVFLFDLGKYGSYVRSYPFSTGYCMLPLFRAEVFPYWLVQMRQQHQTNDLLVIFINIWELCLLAAYVVI
jgi:hypothetical protein